MGDQAGAGGRAERQQVHRDVPVQRDHHVRPGGRNTGGSQPHLLSSSSFRLILCKVLVKNHLVGKIESKTSD